MRVKFGLRLDKDCVTGEAVAVSGSVEQVR